MPSTDPILSLSQVGKRYVKYEDTPTLVSGLMNRRWGSRRTLLWAIRNIDLEVARGEAVGVIGRNGAGKSTMLGLLAGVTAPTEGVVTVRGRVAPLLRLGVGFHEELTGRENVHINATILGLSEPEINEAFDDIVAFAELEEFIDTPVKFYSSGMQARLGFSVAIASRPDILLVDEVLSVGDIGFQMRSFDRMLEMQRNGVTILVVSHNLDAIRRVCSRVLVLSHGTPYFLGDADEAIGHFHDLMRLSWDEVSQGADGTTPEDGDVPMEILEVAMLDDDGKPRTNFETGSAINVRIHARFRRTVEDPMAGLWVMNQGSQLVYSCGSFGKSTGRFEAGAHAYFNIRMQLHLITGTYTLGPWVGWERGGVVATGATSSPDHTEHVRSPTKPFFVSGSTSRGVADLGAQFSINQTEPTAP